MSDLTDRIEQLAAYEVTQSTTAAAELRAVLTAVRRLEQRGEGESKPYKIMTPRQHYAAATRMITEALTQVDDDPRLSEEWKLRGKQHLTAVAHVHAILATVPQSQFDAWKRSADAEAACNDGVRERPAPARHRLQLGDVEPCRHGRSATRCDRCHMGERPRVVCGACGTPSWATRRSLGSRCDLPGCAGLMVAWPGPKP